MPARFSRTKLRRLRNDVDIVDLIADVLNLPSKVSEGYFRFLCPHCSEFNTAANVSTNLARCFRCQRNFNPIDMVIAVKRCTFREAVEFLLPLL